MMSTVDDRFILVYLPELGLPGIIEELGAFASKVKYFDKGIEHSIYMNNEDFIERGSIGYETE